MSNLNLRNITNSFQDVRLISLASWRQANEFSPRDRGGPYMVTQEGYDPNDMKMVPDEFVLGRSGKWLALGHFFRMQVPDRRAEFIFGTAAEVMEMMSALPSKAVMVGHAAEGEAAPTAPTAPETDEMAAAYKAGKSQATPSAT